MAREPLQEKELQIKKTARRRLVGAIAMVVILLIVLPFLLKEQATDSAQDPVKVTIVNESVNSEPIPESEDTAGGFESKVNPTEVTAYTQSTTLPSQQDELPANKAPNAYTPLPQPSAKPAESAAKLDKQTTAPSKSELNEKVAHLEKDQLLKMQAEEKAAIEAKDKADKLQAEKLKSETLEKAKAKEEKAKEEKAKEEKAKEEKAKEEKAANPAKSSTGKFFVQYGVFSDPNNLDNLKNSLKQKGFAVETENIDGSGKKLRLRSPMYASKSEALKALQTVQAAGFNAIVAGK